MTATVNIYGDSIMKGTVLTQTLRYKATICEYLNRLCERFGLVAESRARFGMTVDKGAEIVEKDLSAGKNCTFALLEFGGNDCDYDWKAISEDPAGIHEAKTPLPRFISLYAQMIEKIQARGIVPLVMTLPPIDAQRYLDFLCRGENNERQSIMYWLKDVQRIYRTQERYSNAAARVAEAAGARLVDVRAHFLARDDLRGLLCCDGIHPSAEGYNLIYHIFETYIEENGAFPCGA